MLIHFRFPTSRNGRESINLLMPLVFFSKLNTTLNDNVFVVDGGSGYEAI